MTQKIVRQALEKKLKTWADLNSLPIAFENVPFTPTSAAYVRATLLPSPTISQTLDKEHARYSGIFQVDLVMPNGTGPGAVDSLITSLSVSFAPFAVLNQSGVTVYVIDPPSPAPAIQEAGRYTIPVSIPYEAHTV